MKTLDVLNECLGTMGERPLNSIVDPHSFRGAVLATLDRLSRQVQAAGWWFNREPISLAPSALDSGIYLPGDTLEVRVYREAFTNKPTRQVVLRGNRLYDLDKGSYTFTEPVDVEIVRLIPFEQLPEIAAAHIGTMALWAYQTSYDGDQAKSREIKDRIYNASTGTLQAINSIETRQRQVNMIESNVRLQRIKSITRRARSLL